jgi:hypothetical protein
MGAVALFWQLFAMWNKECQFLAKVFLRIFLAMPVINPSHPAPCDHTSSGILYVESKHFQLLLNFSPICEYRILLAHFLRHTYSEMPFDIV